MMMKLEAFPIGYGTSMAQVQSKLATLRIQLLEITKEKEKHKHVWPSEGRISNIHVVYGYGSTKTIG
jgi:hypothetical protein